MLKDFFLNEVKVAIISLYNKIFDLIKKCDKISTYRTI